MPSLRVLVVGEDPLARSGLAALLAAREDLTVAGQSHPDEAVLVLRAGDTDVLLWDLGLTVGEVGIDILVSLGLGRFESLPGLSRLVIGEDGEQLVL